MRCFFLLLISIFITPAIFAQLSPSVDSIPMTDGKKLAADIYLPNTTDSFPTILVQTPYDRQAYRVIGLPLVKYDLQNSNYAFVIVDWRCFHGSSSACILQPDRGQDGADAVEWITNQPWSNGKVGTWGPSALGRVQYMTARQHPPGLVCIAPLVAASQYSYEEYFPGGVARTEYIQQLDALGFGTSSLLYQNTVYNNVWAFVENQNYYPDEIEVPALMIGGWYDHNVDVMIDLFEGLRSMSPTQVRDQHRLLMGPWAHGGFGPAQVGTSMQGELSYPQAAGWSDSLALLFFDYYLRNIRNGWDQTAFVRYFQMGENQWQSSSKWPFTDQFDTLYLHEGGTLQHSIPHTNNSFSQLQYDPRDPSPTHGGATLRQDLVQGPYDQSTAVESRNDVLTFTTDPFSENVKITGKTFVKLYVSSNRLDTDFAVRLTDVYPDGRSMLLLEGIQRMRFRDGFSAIDTSMMILGTVYPIVIELPYTANTFLAGHRLRIDITSSNYPRFDKNLNNGHEMYVAGDTLIAENKVYHDEVNASFVAFQTTTSTGISKPRQSLNVRVYPNPTSNAITIYNNFNSGNLQIQLLDLQGKVLYSEQQINPSTISLDLTSFSNGVYLLRVIHDGRSYHQKIVLHK